MSPSVMRVVAVALAGLLSERVRAIRMQEGAQCCGEADSSGNYITFKLKANCGERGVFGFIGGESRPSLPVSEACCQKKDGSLLGGQPLNVGDSKCESADWLTIKCSRFEATDFHDALGRFGGVHREIWGEVQREFDEHAEVTSACRNSSIAEMSQDEADSIYGFSGTVFEPLNAGLRGSRATATAKACPYSLLLASALLKLPPLNRTDKLTLYRGEARNFDADPISLGDTVTWNFFASTAKTYEQARRFFRGAVGYKPKKQKHAARLYKIELADATRARSIAHCSVNSFEEEVLFPPGARFRVDRIEEQNRDGDSGDAVLVIHMTEMVSSSQFSEDPTALN